MGLEFAEVVMDVEDRFGIMISSDIQVTTVKDFGDLVVQLVFQKDPQVDPVLVMTFVVQTFEDRYAGVFRKRKINLNDVIRSLG
jgi:hypothetical protein